MKISASAVIALCILVVSGCAASSTAQTGATGAAGATNTLAVAGLAGARIVPVTTAIKYANAGFDIEPPGAAVAKVDMAKAYSTCLSGDAICDSSMSPTVSLAIVTDVHSGTAGADGSLTPILDKTLAWVITYVGAPCVAAGSGANVSKTAAPVIQSCTIINFVSAGTGAVLYSYQGSNP